MEEKEYYEEACRIHAQNPVVDAHLDLAAEIYYRSLTGEKEVIKNHYLEHWKKAGIRLIVSSVYVESRDLPYKGMEMTVNQIAALYEDLDTVEEVCLVKSGADIQKALLEGKIGILLYMEGLDVVTGKADVLRAFYELGVRGASLTWSRRNMLGEGCALASRIVDIPGGLSELGKQTVRKLEELGMFVDISHLNDDGVKDVIEMAERPFIATHSNARSVQMNYRNLTDETIRKVAASGGVMGINAYWEIVGARPGKAGIDKMCDHIQYMMGLAGPEHVGIGLDLCDSYYRAAPRQGKEEESGDCLKNHEELLLITAELLKRGMKEEDIRRFLGQNFIDYFIRVLK